MNSTLEAVAKAVASAMIPPKPISNETLNEYLYMGILCWSALAIFWYEAWPRASIYDDWCVYLVPTCTIVALSMTLNGIAFVWYQNDPPRSLTVAFAWFTPCMYPLASPMNMFLLDTHYTIQDWHRRNLTNDLLKRSQKWQETKVFRNARITQMINTIFQNPNLTSIVTSYLDDTVLKPVSPLVFYGKRYWFTIAICCINVCLILKWNIST